MQILADDDTKGATLCTEVLCCGIAKQLYLVSGTVSFITQKSAGAEAPADFLGGKK